MAREISIFKAYNPIQAVTGGDTYQLHLAILFGVGTTCILLAYRGVRRSRPAGQRLNHDARHLKRRFAVAKN